MKKKYSLLLLVCSILSVMALESLVLAQYDPWEDTAVSRIGKAVNTQQGRVQKDQQDALEQRQEEDEVRRQQEEMMRNPQGFPRQRMSYEAEKANNPWLEKKADTPSGVHVEIFVSDRCSDCERMEQWLGEMGVPYTRHFLKPGSEAEQMYLAQIGRGILPVTRINRRIVRGYETEEVKRIILEEKN